MLFHCKRSSYWCSNCTLLIPGQGECPAEEKPPEGGLQPSPQTSPDELSSPNPDQAAPLLQAQQRPPSQAETEESGAASGTAKMDRDIIDPRSTKDGVDIEICLTEMDREPSEQEGAAEKESDLGRRDREKERETADEGLPPSNGSEDETVEKSEGQKEPSDANNNSLETPQDPQEDLTDTPDPVEQVSESPSVVCHYVCTYQEFLLVHGAKH